MTGGPARWRCCQLGAREHYATPRALHRRGELGGLATDAWVPPGSPWSYLPGDAGRRLAERYSADLASARVEDFTASLVANEAKWRLQGLEGWASHIARNRWFQDHAANWIAGLADLGARPVVFAHSYSALAILRKARERGFFTILGQIDPGPAHFDTVREVARRWPEYGAQPAEPPADYFDDWRVECHLADRIVVNSEWSRDRVADAGVDRAKIAIIPLPFEAEADAAFMRAYPAEFMASRPLRVLFVGSVAAFKGVPSLLEAIDRLPGAPIELSFVGPMAATIPDRYLHDPRVRWIGAVSRSVVMEHCRAADVLVFPSHSDGFGMAQVEAQAWRLPIIASRSCGRVVEDGVNGLLLDQVSAEAIAAALRRVMDPSLLTRLSHGRSAALTTLDAFGAALSELAPRA